MKSIIRKLITDSPTWAVAFVMIILGATVCMSFYTRHDVKFAIDLVLVLREEVGVLKAQILKCEEALKECQSAIK